MVPEPCWLPAPWGGLQLWFDHQGRLARIVLRTSDRRCGAPPPTAVALPFQRYFEQGCWSFELPLAPPATPFQGRLRRCLRAIPSGQTRTYGVLAAILASSPRAVGQGCRANPLPLVVPCHRVVAARATGGYAGHRRGRLAAIKRWLLRHEGVDLT